MRCSPSPGALVLLQSAFAISAPVVSGGSRSASWAATSWSRCSLSRSASGWATHPSESPGRVRCNRGSPKLERRQPVPSLTAVLNRKQQWREWSGYWASSAYADAHDIEYNAIREAAAVIDVSPLYKYRVTGRDAFALVDRVVTRDASKLDVGKVFYTPWCDEHGKVIDDGTVHRLSEDEFFWTAADPQFRWLTLNARGLDVQIEDVTEVVAAVALQGPLA